MKNRMQKTITIQHTKMFSSILVLFAGIKVMDRSSFSRLFSCKHQNAKATNKCNWVEPGPEIVNVQFENKVDKTSI
jgi:hypothetical protein